MSHLILSRFIVLKILKFFKADTAFLHIFKAIFSFLPPLIKNVGIIPVSIGVIHIHRFLRQGLTINKFPSEILEKINPVVLKTLFEAISPHWDICLKKNFPLFKNIFNIFAFFFSLGLLRPIGFKLIKFTLGSILTSLGIAFNEALSTISILKSMSDYILSIIPVIPMFKNLFESLTLKDKTDKIKLVLNKDNYNKIKLNNTIEDTSSLLSIIGIIVLGAGTIIILIITSDYIAPTFIRSVPGIETILDSLYSFGNYILSWIQDPKSDGGDKPNLQHLQIPDSISRTSSNATIVPKTPTMPNVTLEVTSPNTVTGNYLDPFSDENNPFH